MDSPLVEWIFANLSSVTGGGITAVLAFLAWNNRDKVASLWGGVGEVMDADQFGADAVNIAHIRDRLAEAGESSAVEAVDGVILPAMLRARAKINQPTVAETK